MEVDAHETEEDKQEDTTLANSDVITKYQEAAKIVNATLIDILAMCTPGTKVLDICKAGDNLIVTRCEAIFRNKKDGKKIEKGIAFPVCVSVNNCVCHFSPLESDDQVVLALDDMVKIDLGCHVDGYISVAAHTVTIGRETPSGTDNSASGPIVGPKADCMNACFLAAEIAARLIRPGRTNKQVSDAVKQVSESFGVNCIAGTLMHQMKRFVIDANKVILLREEGDQKVPECTFEVNEVYAVDVAMSTGEGKPREIDTRTTIYKRAVDKAYNLKMKNARSLLSEINRKFPTLPFTIRAMEDERNAKLGVRECVQHELLTPYPVLFERTNDFVVHVKFTILVLPNGTSKITGISLPENIYVSTKSLSPENAEILTVELGSKKKKKSNKKKSS